MLFNPKSRLRASIHIKVFSCIVMSSLLFMSISPQGLAQVPAVVPRVTGSIVSLEIITEQGNRVGSGVIVGEPGLLLTSYRLVQGTAQIRAVFDGERMAEVVGVVSAHKGKDLVLLKLRNSPETAKPVPVASQRAKANDPIWLHAGIRSVPTAITSGKVRLLRGGDEQAAHWGSPMSAFDVDAWWIVTDALLPPSGMGGALLTPGGELQGMMVGGGDRFDEVHVAIGAEAIRNLIANRRAKPQPLTSLRKHEDAVAEAPPLGLDADLLPPQLLQRRLSVGDRLDELRKNLLGSEERLTGIRQRQERWRDEGLDKSKQLNELERRVDLIRLERERIRPEERRTRKVTKEVLEDDGKGGKRVRKIELTEEYFEFSIRQNRQIAELNREEQTRRGELDGMGILVQLCEAQLGVAQADEAGQKRYLASRSNELFWLADPLELRSSDVARQFQAALPRLVDAMGTSASIVLPQALTYLRLRQFDECEVALNMVLDLDHSSLPVVQAVRSRVASLQNESARAKKLADEAVRKGKTDVRVQTLLARTLIEKGDMITAGHLLIQATSMRDGDSDLLAAIALFYGTATDSRMRNPKSARRFALQACARTGWQDGLALLSLAGAAAANGDFERASGWLEQSASFHVNIDDDQLDEWRMQLKRKERLSFPWKPTH